MKTSAMTIDGVTEVEIERAFSGDREVMQIWLKGGKDEFPDDHILIQIPGNPILDDRYTPIFLKAVNNE